jgi:hypothetical protein
MKIANNVLPLIVIFILNQSIGDKGDLFGSRTGNLFDRYAASEAAANLVVSAVFNPQRAERLATQMATNDTLPSLLEVLRAFSRNVISLPYTSALHPNVPINRSDLRIPNLAQSSTVVTHEIDDFNRLKPVSSTYLGHANKSSCNEKNYKKDQHNVAVTREPQNELPPQQLRSQVGPSIDSAQSNAAANEQFAVFRFETFISQSVLVNSYLLLLTDAASSFLVKSQLTLHLKELASEMRNFLVILQGAKNISESQNSQVIEGDYLIILEKMSHLEMLTFSISSQKPFLSLLSTPIGPPI